MTSKKIVILDFSTAIVYVRDVPQRLAKAQIETVMKYFCKELDIRESDTQYMMGDLTIDEE